ncbi:glycoside hydrolase 5 family protein [Actinoplanes rectilineatus]|uniref:glycoside hydrolase 5 family protein n=1 Tax=Actinoplanes rectilineatus TaxID=113571 RepID=UPI0012FB846E|nr:glycosyl hydrolase [Actinoplanes rectilineatus]
MHNATPRFGVNYVPSGDWFYEWLSPRWDAVRRDLDGIAALGLDHVRVLPLWPVLQPNRTLIRDQALADVRRVMEIAGEAGLDASVDVLQGHLSSFDFLPSWLSSWHRTNMFTDPDAVAAQADLVAAVHGAVADLPGYLGVTLGNEVNQFSSRPHPSPMPATPAEVTAWLETLLAAAPADGRGLRVHAEYDAVWYQDGHPFLPTHASRFGDVTAVHSWIFNGTAQHYGAMSEQSIRHAEYLIELSRAFATDPHRPVWLQEVGAPLNCLTEAQAPEFCRRTVLAAAESDALWGVTWWCSHDVRRGLGDFPDLEHSLGLFDADGTVKPLGKAFAEVAGQVRAAWRERPASPRTVAVRIPADSAGVPVSRTTLAPGGAVFTAWMEAAARGVRPALVLSETDHGYASVFPPAAHNTPGVYSAVSDSEMFQA